MGSRSRRKGKVFEQEVADRLTVLLGRKVRRRLGQARDGGCDLVGTEPFVVECKRRSTLSVAEWFRQAEAAASTQTDYDAIPMVVAREDNGELLAVVRLTDLLGRLYAALDRHA